MHVVLQPSPSVAHRYRVTLPNKRTVDFGKKDVLYYSDHGDPRLMRAQLLRRGAVIPKELRVERDLGEIHRGMLKISESTEEDWEDFFRAEFWERWILHTHTSVNKAKLSMVMSHGMLFMPTPENLWFCKEEFRDL